MRIRTIWLIITLVIVLLVSFFSLRKELKIISDERVLALYYNCLYKIGLWGYPLNLDFKSDDKPEYTESNYKHFLRRFAEKNYYLQISGKATYSVEELLNDNDKVDEYIDWCRFKRRKVDYDNSIYETANPQTLTTQQKELLQQTLYDKIDQRCDEARYSIYGWILKISAVWLLIVGGTIALCIRRRKHYSFLIKLETTEPKPKAEVSPWDEYNDERW